MFLAIAEVTVAPGQIRADRSCDRPSDFSPKSRMQRDPFAVCLCVIPLFAESSSCCDFRVTASVTRAGLFKATAVKLRLPYDNTFS